MNQNLNPSDHFVAFIDLAQPAAHEELCAAVLALAKRLGPSAVVKQLAFTLDTDATRALELLVQKYRHKNITIKISV